MKNVNYAAAWWDEHRDNARRWLTEMLSAETLQRVLGRAEQVVVGYFSQHPDYPSVSVEGLLKPILGVWTQRADPAHVFGVCDAFHAVLLQLPDGTTKYGIQFLQGVFSSAEVAGQVESLRDACFAGLDLDLDTDELCIRFYPLLLVYFGTFLEVYDSSMGGLTVEERLAELEGELRTERASKEENVAKAWKKMAEEKERLDEAGVTGLDKAKEAIRQQEREMRARKRAEQVAEGEEPIAVDDDEDSEAEEEENPLFEAILSQTPLGLGKDQSFERESDAKRNTEVMFMNRACDACKTPLAKAWREMKEEFTLDISTFTTPQLVEVISASRQFVASMGKGSYAGALLYCPELNSSELAEDWGKKRLIPLLDRVIRDEADDMLAELLQYKGVDASEVLDTVRASRRFVLMTFSAHLLCAVEEELVFTDFSPTDIFLKPLREAKEKGGIGLSKMGDSNAMAGMMAQMMQGMSQ